MLSGQEAAWFTYILIPFFVQGLILQGCLHCFDSVLGERLGELVSLITARTPNNAS